LTKPTELAAPRPTFIGIGAGKSGTTWIWEMLRRHPDVFLPDEKELHYFNDISHEGENVVNPRAAKPMSWYLDHFAAADPGQVCGEVSPSYIWNPTAPARISAYDPATKLFAVLRDPVHRVFSAYLFGVQRGEISATTTFEDALERHPRLVNRSRYGEHLTRYLDWFPREQLHVLLFDDIVGDPHAALVSLERFIGVGDLIPEGATDKANATERPAHPRMTRALLQARVAVKRTGLERWVAAADRAGVGRVYRRLRRTQPFDEKPAMAPSTEARLRAAFADDVTLLEALCARSLSGWRVPAGDSAGASRTPAPPGSAPRTVRAG
jgi:hypothetical protein